MSADSSSTVPPMVRQAEIVEVLSAQLPDRVDGEWVSLEFVANNLSMYSEGIIRVRRPDGILAEAFPPRVASKLLKELRRVMYRPGIGTWFSSTWSLTKDASGVVSYVSFNYDEEPEWDDLIDPGLYGIDLEDFPRDEEHIPAWLRARLAEAEQNAK